MTKRKGVLLIFILFVCHYACIVIAGPKEDGEATAGMLHQKGYRDESASLRHIEADFKKQPENAAFEAQNNALSNTFDEEYDGGRKGEDPLKAHLSEKTVERSTDLKAHQPSLKESQNFVSQKHRFKIADTDPVLDKDTLIKKVLIEHPLDPEGKILKTEAKPKIPVQPKIIKCRQSAPQSVTPCTKRLVVRAIPQEALVKTVIAHFTAQCLNLVSFSINLKTGHIAPAQCESQGSTNLSVVSPLGDDPNLSKATVKLMARQHIGEDGVQFNDSTMTPSVANGFSVGFSAFQPKTGKRHRANEHHSRGGHYVWEFTIPQDPILEEYWEGCEEQEAQTVTKACALFESEQVDLKQSRTIEGYPHPVERPHWTEHRRYICGPDETIDTCEVLLKQGCTQIHSECSVEKNGICLEYENTFNCTPPDYSQETGLGFDEGKLTFLTTPEAESSGFEAGDFGQSAAHLSALLEMAKTGEEGLGGVQGSPDNPSVFQGVCKECRVNFGSVIRDCCKLKGLLQGLLGGCNNDEKQLAIAALRTKRCVKVPGRYCSKEIKELGVKICLEKRDAYCCYGSQLARIIQEIAHQQLHLSWGDAEHPQCQSLTATQLSHLNFDTPYARSKLSEIMAEVQSTAPKTFEAVQKGMSQCDINQKVTALEQNAKDLALKHQPSAFKPSTELP